MFVLGRRFILTLRSEQFDHQSVRRPQKAATNKQKTSYHGRAAKHESVKRGGNKEKQTKEKQTNKKQKTLPATAPVITVRGNLVGDSYELTHYSKKSHVGTSSVTPPSKLNAANDRFRCLFGLVVSV